MLPTTSPPSITTTSRRRRRRPRLLLLRPSSSSSSSTLFLVVVSLSIYLYLSSLHIIISAKEITATNEWQLLGENDTIPAGLHVRVDLSTGEKWAKLPSSEDDDDEKIKAAPVEEEDEGVNVATMDASGALTIVPNDNNNNESENDDNEETTKRDYTMMHRVMSQLPPEELEPFGGLPALPSSSSKGYTKLTAKEQQEFETKMELLWQKRQEELKKLEDSIADLPKILKERIATIKGYLLDSKIKLMEILEERRSSNDDNDDEEEEEEDDGKANNVVKALRDLEFLLSDVDMARDFHTLGGWPYLIALLDETLHDCDVNNNDKDDDVSAAAAALVDEIRALAATTIGTAVSNLGEFRPWALEDVSSTIQELRNNNSPLLSNNNNSVVVGGDEKEKKVTALSLLTQVFKEELDQRTEAMGGGTMAVIMEGGGPLKNTIIAKKAKSRATYKLRAIYGLGSLLRGNPTAQQMFVSNNTNGPDLLVRNVLGTLSNVRGPTETTTLSRLDYKFASKVLALGEDIVMDVVLHDQDYIQIDESTTEDVKEKYAAEGVVTANQLVASFTTEQWCELSLRMLSPPTEVVGESSARGIKERALGAVRAMAPSCQVHHHQDDDTNGSNNNSWGVEEVKRVRAEWNREGSGDGLDPVYRKELLDLVDGVLSVLQ